VVISKFIMDAREIEMDAVALKGEVIAAATHEHIENAGVHSGDATLLIPAQTLSEYTRMRVEEATRMIAKRLEITGPMNIQFLAKGSDVMVIECNLRASRSFPFVSKAMGVDFIEAATKAMLGQDVSDMNLPKLGERKRPDGYVGVKAPMFSFTRLRGADPILGVEMASTGEVACFGANPLEAFLKSLMSTGFKLPKKNILLSVQKSLIDQMIHHAFDLQAAGFELYATARTAQYMKDKGLKVTQLHYPSEDAEPNVQTYIREGKIDLVINLPTHESMEQENNYRMRRDAVDFGVPLMTNLQLVKMFTEAMMVHKKGELIGLNPKSLFEFYTQEKPDEAWTNPHEFH